MRVYYNEIDANCLRHIEALIAEGAIPDGDIDSRDIRDVAPRDLAGYDQCHFFAGVAGWANALRLAEWPADRPIWTGSCPCQPWSACGHGRGVEDARHVWPAFRWLIARCRPAFVVGEQVASGLAVREWMPGVYTDLEALGYRVPRDRAGDYEVYSLPACSIGAPHIRQRLWWLADRCGPGLQGRPRHEHGEGRADAVGSVAARGASHWTGTVLWPCRDGVSRRVPARRVDEPDPGGPQHESPRYCAEEPLAESSGPDVERSGGAGVNAGHGRVDAESAVCVLADGLWAGVDARLFPLAPVQPGRPGALMGAGNAIVPEVAAVFLRAYLEEAL